ncbi:MAG: PKD domain-containing protein [Anaerolineae bacterium]
MNTVALPYWKRFPWLLVVALLATGVLALCFTAPVLAQSPITVDDWGTEQTLTLTVPGVVSSTVTGTVMLGDERDLRVELTSGDAVTAQVTAGALYYEAGVGAQAAALLVWDGEDGDPAALVPTGLGGVDLTGGGTQNAFVLPLTLDANTRFTLTVYTGASLVSTYTVALSPGTGNLPFTHTVPFGAFSGAADFANVGAIALELATDGGGIVLLGGFRTTTVAADLVITKEVYPDPAIAGRSLVYTITVTNVGLGTAHNVIISDTMPPSTTIHTVDQTDSTVWDFDQGDYGLYTEWRDVRPWPIQDDDWLHLRAPITHTGVYTSRVFDAFNLAEWDWLAWTPRRPYGKPLPDNGTAETAYEVGNADMTGNQVLLHLEAISYTQFTTDTFILPLAGIVTDTSGNNMPAYFPAAPGEGIPVLASNGWFGNALRFNGDLRQTLAISDTYDPGRYTLELWVYPEVVTDTALILRTDALTAEIAPGHYSHMLGIRDGKFIHYTNAGGGRTAIGTTDVQTNTWYHIVGTAQSGGELLLYVNGREEARVPRIGALWIGGDHYRLAAGYGPTTTMTYFSGILDEVAVYSRTLAVDEVRDHYLRGALDMAFQVRTCADATCDTAVFAGPGGDPAAYYSERNATGTMPLVVGLDVPDSRYIQYQVTLRTTDLAYTPQLRNVSLGPAHRVVTATQGSCVGEAQSFSCAVGTLAPGQVVTISTSAWIDSAALGWITNTASVTTTVVDANPTDNTVTLSSTVEAEVNLIVEKYDEDMNGGADPVSPGEVITYTLLVRNAGPSVARGVTVTDEFTAGMFISATAPTGWDPCQVDSHIITCTTSFLDVEWDNWQQTYNWEEIIITARAPVTEMGVTNTAWITSTAPELEPTSNMTVETTLITPVANLTVSKIANTDIVDPGATLIYTVTVTNHGPYTATNVVLTDTLPIEAADYAVYPGSLWDCSWPSVNVVTCALLDNLAAGASTSLTFTITAPQTGLIVNTAYATTAQYDYDEDDNWADVYTLIRPVADLAIAKMDTPDPVYAAAPLTYTLTVTNAGPAAAGIVTSTVRAGTGQAMRIDIRPGESRPPFTSVWLNNVPGVIQNVTVTLRGLSHTYPGDLGVLLVGPSGQNVLLMGHVGGGTDVDNLDLVFNQQGAAVTEPLTTGVVYRPTNDGLMEGFRIDGPYGNSLGGFYGSDPNGRWQLYIIDTVYSDAGILANGWQLELTTVTADTIVVTDTLPSGLSVQGPVQTTPGWQCAGSGALTCEADYLAVGDVATFEFVVTAPITGGVITNTAGITSTTADLTLLNNTAVETTTVIPAADLSLLKLVEPVLVSRGDPLTYTFAVENLGPSEVLTTVTLTDDLPAALTAVQVITNGWVCDLGALPALTCTLDSLAMTAAPVLTITANAPITLGEYANTAVVASTTADLTPLNNTSTVTFTVIESPILTLAAYNDSPTFVGDETHLWAVATPEDNVTYTWDFGDGATGAGTLVTHTYPAVGVFTAIVTATNPASVLTATTVVTITGIPTANLSLVKSVEPALVSRGDLVTYTLAVVNLGPSEVLTTVTLTDDLPAALTAVQVITNGWACDLAAFPVLACTLDSLAVMSAPLLTITANAPVTLGEYANTASVVAAMLDSDPLNNTDTVTFTVVESPIAALVAYNDSPTVIGEETHFWAVATPEDNVAYTWDFGNGVSGAGALVTYTYPTTGTFTAIVTATNPTTVLTATTIVTITDVPVTPPRVVYLPLIMRNYVVAPDLVVAHLFASPNQIVVVVRNQGAAPILSVPTNEFWVDVYINPSSPPTAVNQTWQHLASQGLVWGVTADALPLMPGDVLTLTAAATGGPYPYFRPDVSVVTWPLPVGTAIYAQVDSANEATTYGAVLENHEMIGGPYNNIAGPALVSGIANHIIVVTPVGFESPVKDYLPRRP